MIINVTENVMLSQTPLVGSILTDGTIVSVVLQVRKQGKPLAGSFNYQKWKLTVLDGFEVREIHMRTYI